MSDSHKNIQTDLKSPVTSIGEEDACFNKRRPVMLLKIFVENVSNFLKTFRTFRSFENFSRNRSRRDDSFGPKIVEFRAILAIFRPFEDFEFETAPKRSI